jgi:hypothetical protein
VQVNDVVHGVVVYPNAYGTTCEQATDACVCLEVTFLLLLEGFLPSSWRAVLILVSVFVSVTAGCQLAGPCAISLISWILR